MPWIMRLPAYWLKPLVGRASIFLNALGLDLLFFFGGALSAQSWQCRAGDSRIARLEYPASCYNG